MGHKEHLNLHVARKNDSVRNRKPKQGCCGRDNQDGSEEDETETKPTSFCRNFSQIFYHPNGPMSSTHKPFLNGFLHCSTFQRFRARTSHILKLHFVNSAVFKSCKNNLCLYSANEEPTCTNFAQFQIVPASLEYSLNKRKL